MHVQHVASCGTSKARNRVGELVRSAGWSYATLSVRAFHN
jgi:hypothetical protein